MIITYNIGILGAGLKLTGLASLQGQVIQHGLQWQLHRISDRPEQEKIVISEEAQALFTVTADLYHIYAIYRGETIDCGEVQLAQNTLTDAIFVFEHIDVDGDFFAEFSNVQDFNRRVSEREQQLDKYGAATLPLRDPNLNLPPGENSIPAHPLLKDSVQFDGVPPDVRPEPSQNEMALQLTLAAQNNLTTAPTPSLNR